MSMQAIEQTRKDARKGHRLAMWSLAMVPGLLLSTAAAFTVGTLAMARLYVPEGELLTEYGPGGWVMASAVLALMVSPSIIGVVLGVRAKIHGGGSPAIAGLVVNAIVALGLVSNFLLNQLATSL